MEKAKQSFRLARDAKALAPPAARTDTQSNDVAAPLLLPSRNDVLYFSLWKHNMICSVSEPFRKTLGPSAAVPPPRPTPRASSQN